VQERKFDEIPTPFSEKAREDAGKAPASAAPVPAALAAPATAPAPAPAPVAATPAPAPAAARPSLVAIPSTPAPVLSAEPATNFQMAFQEIFLTDEILDAKQVIALASQFSAIAGCTVSTADGLNLIGNQSEQPELETLSQLAPAFFKRIGTHSDEIRMGRVLSVTLQCEKGLVSMFLIGDICLSVLHQNRDFVPGMRDRFLKIAQALAGMYLETGKK